MHMYVYKVEKVTPYRINWPKKKKKSSLSEGFVPAVSIRSDKYIPASDVL